MICKIVNFACKRKEMFRCNFLAVIFNRYRNSVPNSCNLRPLMMYQMNYTWGSVLKMSYRCHNTSNLRFSLFFLTGYRFQLSARQRNYIFKSAHRVWIYLWNFDLCVATHADSFDVTMSQNRPGLNPNAQAFVPNFSAPPFMPGQVNILNYPYF